MTAAPPCFAALDYGTGGAKCVIFDAGGRCLSVAREPWSYRGVAFEYDSVSPGYTFDPDAFWAAVARCSRAALSGAGIPGAAVCAVVTTAQRLGSVFLGDAGREVYCGPNMDGRGFAGALEIMQRIERDRALSISGHWPPFIFSLSRLLWFRAQPDHPRVSQVLALNDWLAWRLSGEVASEPSNACESLLLDVTRRRWSEEILETFEVDPALLPRVVEPGSTIGVVHARAAGETGFAAGTPVLAGGADTQCALLGSGVVSPGDAAAVLGTTTPVMTVTGRPEIDADARLWTGCHVVPDRWTLESNAGDTGITYEWLLDVHGFDGASGFHDAERLVATLGPGPQPILSLAGPQIFDLVNYNPARPIGMLFRHSPFGVRPPRAAFVRAFLENVVCAVRANLEQIEQRLGAPARTLTLSGGMTRSETLVRSFARFIDRPLLLSSEPNATALGAAILAAAGTGAHPDVATATAAMVRTCEISPETERRDEYEGRYGQWRELYSALHSMSV